jgi:ABC-2 type transport system ATP-binding protein
LEAAGFHVDLADDGALRVAASPEDVGRVALTARAVLLELRDGSAGVEDLYFRLTTAPEEELSRV